MNQTKPAHEPWLTIEEHPGRVVRVVRENVRFDSLDEVERGYGALVDVLERLPRARLSLLVDLRAAPSRNDPGFEKTIAPLRKRMWAGFRKRGVLLRSAAGKLQVQRHAAQDGLDVEVFDDLDEALSQLSR